MVHHLGELLGYADNFRRTTAGMLKPFDDSGNEIDSKFDIELVSGGFDLVIESQGGATGGRPPRNRDYAAALAQHLRRMGTLDMILTDLQIASRPVMKLPEVDRRIQPSGFILPLPLARVANPEDLRLAIGRVTAAFGNTKGTGGNPMKRLRLRMEWPAAKGKSVAEIGEVLAWQVFPEAPTANPEELEERVKLARGRMRAKKPGDSTPPLGQRNVPKSSGIASRHLRDPEVIAWVLEAAAGNCERCGNPAPFTRSDGEPFLEVHHVRPLGEGGPDTTDNAAACCPNCHRQLHHDAARNRLRLDLIASVKRLNDYPPKSMGISQLELNYTSAASRRRRR